MKVSNRFDFIKMLFYYYKIGTFFLRIELIF